MWPRKCISGLHSSSSTGHTADERLENFTNWIINSSIYVMKMDIYAQQGPWDLSLCNWLDWQHHLICLIFTWLWRVAPTPQFMSRKSMVWITILLAPVEILSSFCVSVSVQLVCITFNAADGYHNLSSPSYTWDTCSSALDIQWYQFKNDQC